MLKTIMTLTAAISGVLTAALAGVYHLYPLGWIESLAITAGTFFYHFAMRLAVGTAFIPFQKHDPHSKWFAEKPFEATLYKRLKVRKWKDRMPTYDQASFDTQNRTLEEIVTAMCHSELVHETIAVCHSCRFSRRSRSVPFPCFC